VNGRDLALGLAAGLAVAGAEAKNVAGRIQATYDAPLVGYRRGASQQMGRVLFHRLEVA
jgi:hypothetical protein